MFMLANPLTLKTYLCFLCNKDVTFIESDLDYIYRHLIMDHQVERNLMEILFFTLVKKEYLTIELEKFPSELKLAKETIEKEDFITDSNAVMKILNLDNESIIESDEDLIELSPIKALDPLKRNEGRFEFNSSTGGACDKISKFVNEEDCSSDPFNGLSLQEKNDQISFSLNKVHARLGSHNDDESVLSLSISELATSLKHKEDILKAHSDQTDDSSEIRNDSGYIEDQVSDLFTIEEEVAIQSAIEEEVLIQSAIEEEVIIQSAIEDKSETEAPSPIIYSEFISMKATQQNYQRINSGKSEVITCMQKENGSHLSNNNENVGEMNSFLKNEHMSKNSDVQLSAFNSEDTDINDNGNILDSETRNEATEKYLDVGNLILINNKRKISPTHMDKGPGDISVKYDCNRDKLIEPIAIKKEFQTENDVNNDSLQNQYNYNADIQNQNVINSTNKKTPEINSTKKDKERHGFNPTDPIKKELKSPTLKRPRLSISYEEKSDDDNEDDADDDDDEWVPSKRRKQFFRRRTRRSMTTGRKITASSSSKNLANSPPPSSSSKNLANSPPPITSSSLRSSISIPSQFTDSSKCSKIVHRSVKCGKCLQCQVIKNCGSCKNCRDMKRFGGKGKLKQKCEKRKCLTPVQGQCVSC